MTVTNSRRQAFQLGFDTAEIVVVQMVDEFSFEVVDGSEGLQVEHFKLEQAEVFFHNSIVQTVTFTTHALVDVIIGLADSGSACIGAVSPDRSA